MWQCGILLNDLFSGIRHTVAQTIFNNSILYSIVHSMLVFHSEHSNCWICEVISHFVRSAGIWVHLTHLIYLWSRHNDEIQTHIYSQQHFWCIICMWLMQNVLKRSPSYSFIQTQSVCSCEWICRSDTLQKWKYRCELPFITVLINSHTGI